MRRRTRFEDDFPTQRKAHRLANRSAPVELVLKLLDDSLALSVKEDMFIFSLFSKYLCSTGLTILEAICRWWTPVGRRWRSVHRLRLSCFHWSHGWTRHSRDDRTDKYPNRRFPISRCRSCEISWTRSSKRSNYQIPTHVFISWWITSDGIVDGFMMSFSDMAMSICCDSMAIESFIESFRVALAWKYRRHLIEKWWRPTYGTNTSVMVGARWTRS